MTAAECCWQPAYEGGQRGEEEKKEKEKNRKKNEGMGGHLPAGCNNPNSQLRVVGFGVMFQMLHLTSVF